MNLPALLSDSKTPIISANMARLDVFDLVSGNYWQLIEVETLDKMMVEVETIAKPAEEKEVLTWAKMLIGAYPKMKMHDPEIFAKSLVFDMAEFPEDVIKRAVHVVRRESEFLPTCAKMYQACKSEMLQINIIKDKINLQYLGYKRIEQDRIQEEYIRSNW